MYEVSEIANHLHSLLYGLFSLAYQLVTELVSSFGVFCCLSVPLKCKIHENSSVFYSDMSSSPETTPRTYDYEMT